MKFTCEQVHLKKHFHADGRGIKVGVIDGGINVTAPHMEKVRGGVHIQFIDGVVSYSSDWQSNSLHGTACAYIIGQIAPAANLYSTRILDDNGSAPLSALIAGIKWGVEHSIDILNISLGTTDETCLSMLQDACDYASARRVILVAAAHNRWQQSYPAAFQNVIGVGATVDEEKYGYYDYQPGSLVDFLFYFPNPTFSPIHADNVIMSGNSLAAPYITGLVAQLLERQPHAHFEQVRKALIGNCLSISGFGTTPITSTQNIYTKHPCVRKAIACPLTDRLCQIVPFRALLPFDLVAICDFPNQEGSVGLYIPDMQVGPIDEHLFYTVDTIILDTEREIFPSLLADGIVSGKNIFPLSPLDENALETAHRNGMHVVQMHHKALAKYTTDIRESQVPILAVFGTSPNQGELAVQLCLRSSLMERGYKLAQASTDPLSALFNFDLTLCRNEEESLTLEDLRTALAGIIDRRLLDIVIVGSNFATIPFHAMQPYNCYFPSLLLLTATQPDACILVVNNADTDEYIHDTIATIAAIGKTKTILLVLSDKVKNIVSAYTAESPYLRRMSISEIHARLEQLEKTFRIPSTEIITSLGREKLIETIIKYFAE